MSLLSEMSKGPFFDSWESESPGAREKAIRERLDEYVRYSLAQTPFYRERLAAYDPKAEHPLARVPVLNPSELREGLPPLSALLIAKDWPRGKDGRPTDYNVFQSGGTTGFPKTTLFSHQELELLTPANARGFHALGLGPEDRVANLFAVGGLYMTFLHINRMLQQYGCMNFPFSNHTPVDFIHTVVKLFGVNTFAGITSVVLNALRGIAEAGAEGIRIEKVFYGGEHIYEADKNEIREKFGTKLIAAPGYGTVDTWYLGYQCLACPTGVFHAHDDQAYIELVDEDTGEHCKPGETGMMYATAFPRRLTPVVRYRVGDLAYWLKEPCPCGRTTPLFQLLGRGDDVLRIGFDSVDYNFVQESVSRVPGLLGTVQIEKKRKEGRDLLVIRVETEARDAELPALAARLAEEVQDRRPSLRHFIHEGTVWPLQIELLRPNTIPRNPRTGKLIRVIDAISAPDRPGSGPQGGERK